jgi:hypothetical protein
LARSGRLERCAWTDLAALADPVSTWDEAAQVPAGIARSVLRGDGRGHGHHQHCRRKAGIFTVTEDWYEIRGYLAAPLLPPPAARAGPLGSSLPPAVSCTRAARGSPPHRVRTPQPLIIAAQPRGSAPNGRDRGGGPAMTIIPPHAEQNQPLVPIFTQWNRRELASPGERAL